LLKQLEALEANLEHHQVDWCIFANFALANLGSGRTTILMSPKWDFSEITRLPQHLQPESLTCGPAFLNAMLNWAEKSKHRLSSLKSIHVGGALTDCSLFERAFGFFGTAEITHLYGSTEAEPVARMDARLAVQMSRQAGYQQTLVLGRPVTQIHTQIESDALWISGDHVCPNYWGDHPDNHTHKRTDTQGLRWHNMGDRVTQDASGVLWYRGRSFQSRDDFELEQRCYADLGPTRALIHRDAHSRAWLLGEGVVGAEKLLRSKHPQIFGIEDLKIVQDARHRARIDRNQTLRKGAPWLAG
jgi:hypothetical protein